MSIIANGLQNNPLEMEKKKVLIITYYWPPSGGAGVQRWLKFSKYLPDLGWEPIVFTPENPGFDLRDYSLLEDVHPDIEVLKFPIWEPYKIFKIVSGRQKLNQGQILEDQKTSLFKKLAVWLRGNLFVPDPKRFWIKPSIEYVLSILEANEVKHIITTGPPHSIHLIGKGLKLKNPALTWIADFRDPWTEWTILKRMSISRPIWKIHKRMEQEVLKMADLTLATSPTAAEEFQALGARKVLHITNGFDKADYPVTFDHSDKDYFQMTYVGMLSVERNPKTLWEALNELCAKEGFSKKFRLNITGIISPVVRHQIEELSHLAQHVNFQDSINHKEVFALYQRSNLLLLLQSNEEGSFSQLPGKLFEYLGSKRPIMALGYPGSDIDQILSETNAGKLFSYDDQAGIAKFLSRMVLDNKGFKNQESNVTMYERSVLAKRLSELLNTL